MKTWFPLQMGKLSKCCHKNEMLDETRMKPIQHANCVEWTWKCCMKCRTNDSVAAWEYTFLWGTTYLHIWIHIYILNFCTPLSCNSSLKSHRSSHHRCKNLYLYKLYLQKVPKWSQIFIFLFIAYRFASHFCCFCTVSFCKKSDSLCNVWSAEW